VQAHEGVLSSGGDRLAGARYERPDTLLGTIDVVLQRCQLKRVRIGAIRDTALHG